MAATRVDPVNEEIQRLGSWQPEDPEDLDGTIKSVSGITRAVGQSFRRIGARLEQAGVHREYPEALHENGEAVAHTAADLEGRLGGGLMSHGGGHEGRSRSTRPVIDTIEELGGWDPDGPDDLHDTIRQLGSILRFAAGAYTRIGDTLRKTAAHHTYGPELDSAAGNLLMAAADIDQRMGGGVMRRGGG
jgi:hypothetical protein